MYKLIAVALAGSIGLTIAFSSNSGRTVSASSLPQNDVPTMTKKVTKKVWHKSKDISRKTWHKGKHIAKKSYRKGRWITIKTAHGTKRVFVKTKRKAL